MVVTLGNIYHKRGDNSIAGDNRAVTLLSMVTNHCVVFTISKPVLYASNNSIPLCQSTDVP